jgi:ferritin-like metal-binding protein YciE
MAYHDTIVAWLNDAHALEVDLALLLEHHVREAGELPWLQAQLHNQLEQSRRHIGLVQGCIERLGGSISPVAHTPAAVSCAVRVLDAGSGHNELVRNTLATYASEHLKIGTYTSLMTVAQALGDQETAGICQQILDDEMGVAHWIERQLPLITEQFLVLRARQRTKLQG